MIAHYTVWIYVNGGHFDILSVQVKYGSIKLFKQYLSCAEHPNIEQILKRKVNAYAQRIFTPEGNKLIGKIHWDGHLEFESVAYDDAYDCEIK